MYSSHGSVIGNSDLIALFRGKENEWMERMEMSLGSQQFWEIDPRRNHDDVSQVWSEIIKTFNIGNIILK